MATTAKQATIELPTMADLTKKLAAIQSRLKAPKNQYCEFGKSKYKYRSCEDILEALKPLVHEQGCIITLEDKPIKEGERYYIESTAILSDGYNSISKKAYARESETKAGMDSSQVTGATSSYARKYALNGLFAIDDTKDADTMDNRPKAEPKAETDPTANELAKVKAQLKQAKTGAEINSVYKPYLNSELRAQVYELCAARSNELKRH